MVIYLHMDIISTCFVEKAILFPSTCLCTFVKNQLTIKVRVYFCTSLPHHMASRFPAKVQSRC